ncbi:MAG: hypothetical protein KBF41_15485 [Azonexus sp.]|nr:hypothetical protein [Azonexus sp.]
MANSTTNIDTISQAQAGKEVTANSFFDAVSQPALYGRRASTCAGLTWGYYGGNFTLHDGTISQIANGTLSLTASATNYLTSLKSTGAIYSATDQTAWNDVHNYVRLYSIVTGTATVTSYTDAREIGKMSGFRRPQSPVIKTSAFTWGDTEDFVVVNGSASVTATLPDVTKFPGRTINLKTIAAFTVISASSNVKPIDTNTAGTAILAATAGKWATLVCDGSHWIVMASN